MSCYLVNRSPSMALVDKTPYDAWDGKNPSLEHFKVFGCEAFLDVPKEKRRKLASKSEKCIFIRYKDGVKGYKLWNPVTRKIVYNRDVIFIEVGGTSSIEEVKREKEPKKIEFDLNDGGNDLNELTEFDEEVEQQTQFFIEQHNNIKGIIHLTFA